MTRQSTSFDIAVSVYARAGAPTASIDTYYPEPASLPRRGCELVQDKLHSTLTLASRMILPHLADSRRMRSAKASGELTIGKMKFGARNFSRKAGSSKIC